MTEEQRDRLRRAVGEVNSAIEDIKQTDGEATIVRAHGNYDAYFCRIVVEITTGCEIFNDT